MSINISSVQLLPSEMLIDRNTVAYLVKDTTEAQIMVYLYCLVLFAKDYHAVLSRTILHVIGTNSLNRAHKGITRQ